MSSTTARPPEQSFKPELILRDHLALDRTVLANERTLLAYFRMALASAAVGAGLLQLFTSLWADLVGAALLLGGTAALAVGTVRFRHAAADRCHS